MLITADERTLLFHADNESARVKGRNKQPRREGVRRRGGDVTDEQNTDPPSATAD